MGTQQHHDFESFWKHFVRSHTRPATQWMHTAGVALWCTGAALSVVRRRPGPFLVGSVAFTALALGAHPLFEHDLPQNTSSPLYGIAGNFRMAWHVLRGTMATEVENARPFDVPSSPGSAA